MGLRFLKVLVVYFVLFFANGASEDCVTIPNTFSNGATTSASDMSANFNAVKTAVDDNNERITTLESKVVPIFQGYSSTSSDGAAGVFGMVSASNLCN